MILLLFLIRFSMNWQRKSISYIYGYQGTGAQLGNSLYQIDKSYPEIHKYYGLLSGLLYTLPFSLGGIFLNFFNTMRFSETNLLCTVVGIAGISSILTGVVNSFPVLVAMRIVHAICFSMTIPLIATLVHRFFPRSQRGTANSILYSANYIGTAISSLSILVIGLFGWRNIYNIMGITGISIAALTTILLKKKDFKKKIN
jgi:MFS family permease